MRRYECGIKHPIYLPNTSHFTALLILHYYHLVGHSGMGHTWTSIRQTYWIIKGVATVRRVIGHCILCKKRNASVSQQIMTDLSQGRLRLEKSPFYHVGIHPFGPLIVRQRRSNVKRYRCILTCLTTRIFHLELAHNLTTDFFINTFRRFICSRGSPDQIYSDNASNFVGAQRMLRKSLRSWNQEQIVVPVLQSHRRLGGRGVQRINVPLPPIFLQYHSSIMRKQACFLGNFFYSNKLHRYPN